MLAQHPPTKAEEHYWCIKALISTHKDGRAHKKYEAPYSKRYREWQYPLTHLVHVSVNHTNETDLSCSSTAPPLVIYIFEGFSTCEAYQ